MQRSGVLKRIFACVIALALVMPMTVQTGWAATTSYTVTVADGYLALRNAKAYDDKNEIGKLYTCLLYTSMQTWPLMPTIQFGTLREFYASLEEKREQFPVVELSLIHI